MRRWAKALFASLTLFAFLAISSTYAAQVPQGSSNYSAEVIKYLDKMLIQAPKSVNVSFEKLSRQGKILDYEYSLSWSWGSGSAAVYVYSGKDYLIKYSLKAYSEKMCDVMFNFLKKCFGLSDDFHLGNYIFITGEAFPGTQIYFEKAVDEQISFKGFHFSLGIPKATVMIFKGTPVSASMKLYSTFPLPPTAFQNSSLIKVCQEIMGSLGILTCPRKETVEFFIESKDLLGSLGGSVIISTLGKVKNPGTGSISVNSYGQITSAEVDRMIIVSPQPSKEGLEEVAVEDYLTFLHTISLYSNNPEFSSFVSELSKSKEGSYLGGHYVLKVSSSSKGKGAVSCKLVKVGGNISIGTALCYLRPYNYTSPHGFTENMIVQLYSLPKVSLKKVPPKISTDEVSKEISSMLGSGYSISGISLVYLPRGSREMPEYVVNCKSDVGVLTLYVSGINGEVMGASYHVSYSKSSEEDWSLGLEIGLPVGIGIGVASVLAYRRRKRGPSPFHFFVLL